MRCEQCGVEKGKLLTASDLANEYGLKRAAAEAVMRQIRTVEVPGLRRVYVRRDAVERFLRECER